MRVWTIQPVKVYEQLNKDGYFHADSKMSELLGYDNFQRAYEWMMLQMEERIGTKPSGVRTPIWAWHTFDFTHKKPDLRRREFNVGNGEMVCIELEVSEEDVLLSDEDAWHFVLGDYYLPSALCKIDSEKEEAEYDALSYKMKAQARKESWNRIFNLSPHESSWMNRGKFIQATFWEMRLEQVKGVRYFKGRK